MWEQQENYNALDVWFCWKLQFQKEKFFVFEMRSLSWFLLKNSWIEFGIEFQTTYCPNFSLSKSIFLPRRFSVVFLLLWTIILIYCYFLLFDSLLEILLFLFFGIRWVSIQWQPPSTVPKRRNSSLISTMPIWWREYNNVKKGLHSNKTSARFPFSLFRCVFLISKKNEIWVF